MRLGAHEGTGGEQEGGHTGGGAGCQLGVALPLALVTRG